jgi:hypothetical protein
LQTYSLFPLFSVSHGRHCHDRRRSTTIRRLPNRSFLENLQMGLDNLDGDLFRLRCLWNNLRTWYRHGLPVVHGCRPNAMVCFWIYRISLYVFRPKWTVWYSRHQANDMDVCIFEFESMLLFTNCEKFADAVRETVAKWQDNEKGKVSPCE